MGDLYGAVNHSGRLILTHSHREIKLGRHIKAILGATKAEEHALAREAFKEETAMRKLLIVSTAAIVMGYASTALAEGVANPPEGTFEGTFTPPPGGGEDGCRDILNIPGTKSFGLIVSRNILGGTYLPNNPGLGFFMPTAQDPVLGPLNTGPGAGDHLNLNQLRSCGVGRHASPANRPLP